MTKNTRKTDKTEYETETVDGGVFESGGDVRDDRGSADFWNLLLLVAVGVVGFLALAQSTNDSPIHPFG